MDDFKELAVLKYNIEYLLSQRSVFCFAEHLKLKFIPLVKKLYPDLVKKWSDESSHYSQLNNQFKSRILFDITAIFTCIKKRLKDNELLKIRMMQEHINALESALSDEPQFYYPRNDTIAFERLKELCTEIVILKREDLVSEYVESFSEINEYVEIGGTIYQCNDCWKLFPQKNQHQLKANIDELICPECSSLLQHHQKRELRKTKYIERFDEKTFVPAFFALCDLHEYFWGSAAGAWVLFKQIDSFWMTSDVQRDYFRKKLRYETTADCERTMDLLTRNLLRSEVRKIKGKREGKINEKNAEYIAHLNEQLKIIIDVPAEESPHVLSLTRLQDALKKVKNELFKNVDYNKIACAYGPEFIEIYQDQKTGDLRLKVEWTARIAEIYHLTSFREKGDYRNNFFQNLLNNINQFVVIDSRYPATQCLQEAGIADILADLLLNYSDKKGASLKGKRVRVPVSKAKKMRKFLLDLKTVM